MSRGIRISEPSAEMQMKIIRARKAIAQQKPRYLRCPYCQHNALAVYVETKCKKCGEITVFDVLSMRRTRFHPQ